MKLVIVLASAMFALTAVAGEYSKPSSVLFQSASTYVPATKVCRDGDTLKPKGKSSITYETCDESESGSKYNCKMVTEILLQPVVSTAYRCDEFTGSDDQHCAQDGRALWNSIF